MSRANLTPPEIHEILKRYRGSMAILARDLGVSQVSLHNWLVGKTTSERIAKAAAERAMILHGKELTHAPDVPR